MRRLLIVSAIVIAFPGVAAAGGGGHFSPCVGYTEGTAISMLDSCFSGTAHFAPSETTITINNDGELPHTFTAVDGSFDTGWMEAGESTELVVDEPGIYRVFCTLHGTAGGDGMAGVLVVGEAVPAAMSAPLDTSAIERAVAAEAEALVVAVDAQAAAIQDLETGQTELLAALGEVPAGQPTAPPEIVVVSEDGGTVGAAVMIVAGLGAGLALSALLTVLRMRRSGEPMNPELART